MVETETKSDTSKKPTLENNEKYVTQTQQQHEHDDDDDRKINYRGWKAMPFIIGNETFEKLGAIGTLANLLVYLTTVFNLKNITATNMINIFNGSTNFATLIGAFFSDTYFGRYKTLGFCTTTSFLGLLVIQLTAAFKNLHPPKCGNESSTCKGPTAGQMAFLLCGFGLLLIGAAGVRPCNLAFGADQFNPNTESGKKGVNSFFNWYFFTFTFAQMVSLTLIVYVQSNVSWALGLGIPAALMLLSVVVFFLGTKIYVKVQPSGSPITSIVQVLVVAIKKRGLKKLPQKEYPMLSLFNYVPPKTLNSRLPYTHQFSVSALVLIPQLALAGLSESFTAVGQVEFYYKQFPENMRSIGQSLFYCGMAGSSYLSTLLISIVHKTTAKSATGNWLPEDLNKGRLDYFYFMIAALEVMNLGYFLMCSRWYKYKGNNDSYSNNSSIELNGVTKTSETSINGV